MEVAHAAQKENVLSQYQALLRQVRAWASISSLSCPVQHEYFAARFGRTQLQHPSSSAFDSVPFRASLLAWTSSDSLPVTCVCTGRRVPRQAGRRDAPQACQPHTAQADRAQHAAAVNTGCSCGRQVCFLAMILGAAAATT